MKKINDESRAEYIANNATLDDDKIISQALAILSDRVQRGLTLNNSTIVKNYLIVKAGSEIDQTIERFGCLWLDAQNRLISMDIVATGTITSANVHPREVIKSAISAGAVSVILTHNHPSGNVLPSENDTTLTKHLKSALEMINVHVLDHVITGGGSSYSFSENGLC